MKAKLWIGGALLLGSFVAIHHSGMCPLAKMKAGIVKQSKTAPAATTVKEAVAVTR